MIREKIIIITGASKGIGKATAIALAKKGATVVLASRSEDKLKELSKEINKFGNSIAIPTDVTKEKDIKNLIDLTVEKYNKIDVMINNAGIYFNKEVKDTTEDEWNKVINTNLKSVFLGSKYALKQMIEQKKGYIINIASVAAKRSAPRKSAYCASKHAVLGFTNSLRKEAKKYNIDVTAVCPSAANTELFGTHKPHVPKKIMLTPQQIAEKIKKLITSEKKPKIVYIVKPKRILYFIMKKIF